MLLSSRWLNKLCVVGAEHLVDFVRASAGGQEADHDGGTRKDQKEARDEEWRGEHKPDTVENYVPTTIRRLEGLVTATYNICCASNRLLSSRRRISGRSMKQLAIVEPCDL